MRVNDKKKILAHLDMNAPAEESLYYNQFILPFSVDVEYSARSDQEKISRENEILDHFANEKLFYKAEKNTISGQLEDYFFDSYFDLYDIEHNKSSSKNLSSDEKERARVSKCRIFNFKKDYSDDKKYQETIGKYTYISKDSDPKKNIFNMELSLDVDDMELRVLKLKTQKARIEKNNTKQYQMTILVMLTISCYKQGLSTEEEEKLSNIGYITPGEISNDAEHMYVKNVDRDSDMETDVLKHLEKLVLKQKYIKFVGDKFKILYDMAEVKDKYNLELRLNEGAEHITLKNTAKDNDDEEGKGERINETIKQLMKFLTSEYSGESKEITLLQEKTELLNSRRMFANVSVQNTKLAFDEIDYFKLEEEIGKGNKKHDFDDIVLYSNLDYQYPTIQNNKFLYDFLEKNSYLRWTNYGSMYVCCSIANVYMCENGAPDYLISNQHTIYQELYMLVLIQSLLLNSFHDELLGAKNQLHDMEDIIDEFQEDVNRWLMFKISSEIQGIELYEQYQTGLNIKELYAKLSNEVSIIQATLGNRDTKQVNETVDNLTNRANAIAYISLIVAIVTFVVSLPSQYATSTSDFFAAAPFSFEKWLGFFGGDPQPISSSILFIIRMIVLYGASKFAISKLQEKYIERQIVKEKVLAKNRKSNEK